MVDLLSAIRSNKLDGVYRSLLSATARVSGVQGDRVAKKFIARAREALQAAAPAAARDELFRPGLTDDKRDRLYADDRLSPEAKRLWLALAHLTRRASEANAIRRAAEQHSEIEYLLRAFLAGAPDAPSGSDLLARARKAKRPQSVGQIGGDSVDRSLLPPKARQRFTEAVEVCRKAKTIFDIGFAKGLLIALAKEGVLSDSTAHQLFQAACRSVPVNVARTIPADYR